MVRLQVYLGGIEATWLSRAIHESIHLNGNLRYARPGWFHSATRMRHCCGILRLLPQALPRAERASFRNDCEIASRLQGWRLPSAGFIDFLDFCSSRQRDEAQQRGAEQPNCCGDRYRGNLHCGKVHFTGAGYRVDKFIGGPKTNRNAIQCGQSQD